MASNCKIKFKYKITKVVEENKETKYVVGFIGDNSHSVLPKNKIAKFVKEMKSFSKTRKKKLLNSINIAKSLMEEKLNKLTNDEKNEKKVEEHIQKANTIDKGKKLLRKKRILKRRVIVEEENLKQGMHFYLNVYRLL